MSRRGMYLLALLTIAQLAGTWTTEHETYNVAKNGKFVSTIDDGRVMTGRWKLTENHTLEITTKDHDVAYYRIIGVHKDKLVLAGPSYAFTATPRKCPCTTFVRAAPRAR